MKTLLERVPQRKLPYKDRIPTIIRLPPKLKAAVQKKAAAEGTTMEDIGIAGYEQYLEEGMRKK